MHTCTMSMQDDQSILIETSSCNQEISLQNLELLKGNFYTVSSQNSLYYIVMSMQVIAHSAICVHVM